MLRRVRDLVQVGGYLVEGPELCNLPQPERWFHLELDVDDEPRRAEAAERRVEELWPLRARTQDVFAVGQEESEALDVRRYHAICYARTVCASSHDPTERLIRYRPNITHREIVSGKVRMKFVEGDPCLRGDASFFSIDLERAVREVQGARGAQSVPK